MLGALAFLAAFTAPLADPGQEARARALDAEIRCIACENEPISQSGADIAGDMRALVRARIAAGDSDAQIRAFFVRRYGEFVLLRPPFKPETILLWAAPLALLAAGGALAWRQAGKGPPAPGGEPEDDRLQDEL